MASIPLNPYYCFDDDETVVQDFINDKAFNLTHDQLADTINAVAQICAANASYKGFHQDEQDVLTQVNSVPARDAVKNQFFQAEVARIGEEVGELVAAIRKPKEDTHIPTFTNIAIELADIVIRVFDASNKRGISIGEAIIQKLIYNATRPYKHGKNS